MLLASRNAHRMLAAARIAASAACLASIGTRNASAADAAAPLSIEDAVGMRSFAFSARGDTQSFSPDGALVAYGICDPRRTRARKDGTPRMDATRFTDGCEVRLSPVEGGEPVIVAHDGAGWAPSWSPDGQRIAYYGDDGDGVHVWIWDRGTRTSRRAAPEAVDVTVGEEVPIWTRDGLAILSRLPSPRRPAATGVSSPTLGGVPPALGGVPPPWAAPGLEGTTVEVERSGGPAGTSSEAMLFYPEVELASIDATTGEVTRWTTPARIASYWLSPDGRWLAFTRSAGIPTPQKRTYRWELGAVDLVTHRTRILAGLDQFHATSLRWSPDGKAIVYFSGGSEEKGASCFVVSLDGSPPRRLEGASDFGTLTWQIPVWAVSGRHIYAIDAHTLWRGDVAAGRLTAVATFPRSDLLQVVADARNGAAFSPDGGSSVFVSARNSETKRAGVLRVTVATGEGRLLEAEGFSFGARMDRPSISADGRTWAYVAESGDHPQNLWVASLDFAKRRRLTSINPALEKVAFGATRIIDFQSRTGKPLKATLLLPAGYSRDAPPRRVPLIAWVYGGDMGSDAAYRFGVASSGAEFNLQMLATRGYAVLYPDVPLETGAHVKSLVDAVLPAIDKAVELGVADPDRLGIMGVSSGGYATFALVTQTKRFRAAVACAGFGDLASFYGHGWASWLVDGKGAIGKAPWQAPDRYVENSPVYFLDRVSTPLLIEAGSDDRAVGEFPKQIFTDLKVLDKNATYLRYRGEGHNIALYPNLIDFWSRVTAFFDRYVRNPASETDR